MSESQKENDLFFVCSLIENISRKTKNTKKYVVEKLGKQNIQKIYEMLKIGTLPTDVAQWLNEKNVK